MRAAAIFFIVLLLITACASREAPEADKVTETEISGDVDGVAEDVDVGELDDLETDLDELEDMLS